MKFLLFGTGDYYERYKKWFDSKDVLALLDNSETKQNTIIDGIQVLLPEDGVEQTFDVIVILSFYVKEMKKQLLDLGVSEDKIYHFYDLHKLIEPNKLTKSVRYFKDAERIVKSDGPKEKILLLSQDMTLGGPAIALLNMAEILLKHGYDVIYASMIDGPLRERIISYGISVIVDENMQVGTMHDVNWIGKFSLLFCNTINFHVFLSKRDITKKTIWWLHDSSFFYSGVDKAVLQNINRMGLNVYSVGPVPKNAIQTLIPDMPVNELLYGVADIVNCIKKTKNDRICFVTIGYIEKHKGQDILLQAIKLMPQKIRKKAVFYLVGQNTSIMAENLKKEIKKIPEIIITGTLTRDGIDEILNSADVLICPSRQDSMPTVAAEAMMHSVPCILSDATGTAAYIQQEIDGFIFRSEDACDLLKKMEWCIENPDKLSEFGIKSRLIYEKYFSMKTFEKNLLNVIKGIV